MLPSMSETDLLGDLFEYVGFGHEDAEVLATIGPLVSPAFDEIVTEFYLAVERTPRAMAVFREGHSQIERQKARLKEWLEEVFGGVYDRAYLERRTRIGQVHMRIRLEQRYMFGGMNLVRRGLHAALDAADADADLGHRGHIAVDKICDVELAIMLEIYRDHHVAQQRAQERLATLGQLAASIGHELRNPLAVMSTSTHLLRKRLDQNGHALKHIDKIQRQIDISERIIGDLLALAGDRPPQLERVDLAALVRDVCDSLAATDRVEIHTHLCESLPGLWVDGGQLRQVLLNLLTNAIQAVETERGQVEIRARIDDKDHLTLDVLDDGPGFPEGMLDRVFEPLFTTKSDGIGLGLALCARIVEKHGGTIRAHHREGGGAHVAIRIPNVLESP